MKNSKKRLAFAVLSVGAMALIGCEKTVDPKTCKHKYGNYAKTVEVSATQDGKEVATCSLCKTTKEKITHYFAGEWTVKTAATELLDGVESRKCANCNETEERPIPKLGFSYNVKIKDASGAEIYNETLRSVNKIPKQADPVAPAGKVFYGWKNIKNGGQIWNFDDDVLGLVSGDVELEPVFVDSNVNAQNIEAEFAPIIIEANSGTGMEGATYSGGAKGRQLIYEDANYEYGSSCEQGEFKYYKDPTSLKWVTGDGAGAKTKNPKADKAGYFVHFNYCKGNDLVFNINCSEAVENVTIFGRFSAEYGKAHPTTFDRYSSFSQDSFPITVNGTKLEYGTITMHNIPDIGSFLPFQDFMLSANVSLKAGANTISMKVDNTDTVNGTISSTSPCIDALKIYTTATITWPEASLVNIIK